MPTCPHCGHLAIDHGTYGCLFGWEWAKYHLGLIQGCRCERRGVGGDASTDWARHMEAAR